MVKQAEIPRVMIDTALALAAERGWHELSWAEIAEAAKVPLAKAYQVYPSKQAILEGFSRAIDIEVLADDSLAEEWDDDSGARDRLFDVLMRRFDALQPYREGLGNLAYDQARDPLAALCSLGQLLRSMAAMLEAARVGAGGLGGSLGDALRAKGLAGVYLATLRVWLRDDSADMAKTMAALDGHLRRIEGLLRRFARRPGDSEGAAAGGVPESPPGDIPGDAPEPV
ncbi:MAG: TetR/AcrR family transcriptional regulator [Rhodospirillales bacterium]|nr:TetR/AcrR family transcriptional regulator [Rhodospirillales bacterium]